MSFTREERDRAALAHGALTCVRQTTRAPPLRAGRAVSAVSRTRVSGATHT